MYQGQWDLEIYTLLLIELSVPANPSPKQFLNLLLAEGAVAYHIIVPAGKWKIQFINN